MRARARARRALLGLVVVALLGACRLELDVNVTVERDGSGTVEVVARVDDDAIERVGGDLEAVLALDDLRASGWTVDGPTRGDDGRTTVRVQRAFADPDDAEDAFAELSGERGPFQDLAVARDRSLTRTRWRFSGRMDLGGDDVEVPGGALDDEQLAALEDQLGQSLSRLVQVRVRVRLPGEVRSNATTKADNGAVWQVAFGGEPIDLEATGTERRTSVYVAGGLLGLAVVVLAVAGLVRLAMRTTARQEGGATRSGRGAP